MRLFTTARHAVAATSTSIVLTLAYATPSLASDLTIAVKGITASQGTVYIAIYKADSWLKVPVMNSQLAVHSKEHLVILKDLPEGEYAISSFWDQNNNGTMDKNVMGIPTEPYCFSNNAVGKFGPASFEQAKFQVSGAQAATTITFTE